MDRSTSMVKAGVITNLALFIVEVSGGHVGGLGYVLAMAAALLLAYQWPQPYDRN